VILKCNGSSKIVVVDQVITEATPQTIGELLPDSSPRFVLINYEFDLDDAHKHIIWMLINFNPLDTEPTMKMMYQATKYELVKAVGKGAKEIELNDTNDFSVDSFRHKAIGLSGKTTDQIVSNDNKRTADSRRVSYY